MKEETRNKVALVVFVLILIAAGAILVSYFSTGRSWSVVATTVDDHVGQMGDYSVVVFEGTLESKKKDGPYVSDVRKHYASKEAGSLTLNLADHGRYKDPIVFDTGNKKIGVFEVDAYTSRATITRLVTKLRESGAEFVICITPKLAHIPLFDGIDTVILTTENTESALDRDTGGTFVMTTPEKGSTAVLFISSNNVPSLRVVEEL